MQSINYWEMLDQQVFTQVIGECAKYGYSAYLRFGCIFVYTKFESWRIEVSNSNFFKIFHGSNCGHAPQKYHYQFKGRLSVEELITYIHQHEVAKYTPQFVQFTVHPMSA